MQSSIPIRHPVYAYLGSSISTPHGCVYDGTQVVRGPGGRKEERKECATSRDRRKAASRRYISGRQATWSKFAPWSWTILWARTARYTLHGHEGYGQTSGLRAVGIRDTHHRWHEPPWDPSELRFSMGAFMPRNRWRTTTVFKAYVSKRLSQDMSFLLEFYRSKEEEEGKENWIDSKGWLYDMESL